MKEVKVTVAGEEVKYQDSGHWERVFNWTRESNDSMEKSKERYKKAWEERWEIIFRGISEVVFEREWEEACKKKMSKEEWEDWCTGSFKMMCQTDGFYSRSGKPAFSEFSSKEYRRAGIFLVEYDVEKTVVNDGVI